LRYGTILNGWIGLLWWPVNPNYQFKLIKVKNVSIIDGDLSGGLEPKPKTIGKKRTRKKEPEYIRLKQPSDVMAYAQRLVNRLRRDKQEIEQLGKITNLLNTWIAAHKDYVETQKADEDGSTGLTIAIQKMKESRDGRRKRTV
jgi:hypothetical protein